MSKLFVGNLHFNVNESVLEMFIRECGLEIQNVKIIRDVNTGRSRGFGFIELGDGQDVQEAISALNGKTLEGRSLRVDRAHERTTRSPRGRRGRW